MTELALIDAEGRRHHLLGALRRLMVRLFTDPASGRSLLSLPDVGNVLILPPQGEAETCRVVVKDGTGVRPIREVAVEDVRRFLAFVAGFAGRELNRRHPTLDVVLPETGERIHADVEPVAPGPSCAIRRPWRGRVTLEHWTAAGAMTETQADVLRGLVHSRATIVVAGLVDTGKTTLLRALLAEPAFQRGLPAVLQDPYEFEPPCPNAWALVADPGGDPPVTLEALVAGALRVPITHLVLGEVRRSEARQMIVAWATGHPGICTVHAGAAEDALDRIAQMVGLSGVVMDATQMRWIAGAVDVVVHLATDADGRRHLATIARVEGWSPETGFRLTPVA